MDVSIEFRSVEPPAGRTCRVDNGEWLAFAGWLDLISALERLLQPSPPGTDPEEAVRT
jgi:hypothetical protein